MCERRTASLSLKVHTSHLFMCADEHQVYLSGPNIKAVISDLTKEAENVSQWYKGNLLLVNPPPPPKKKKQVLPQISAKVTKDECPLVIDNQGLKLTANLRILGVNTDDELTFSGHVSDICKKAGNVRGTGMCAI